MGIWTIGYGHTKGFKKIDGKPPKLSKSEIINQDMFDALESFTFNVGTGNLSKSTLLELLNQGKYSEASEQFTRWVFAGGQKLDGLVRRRKAEQKLFRSKV